MNDGILGIIVGRSEEDLVSRSNETRSHLFSSFILHFHSKKNLARREPWLVGESSSPMQFHPPYLPYPFYPCSLLCIQVDLYIYPPSPNTPIPSSGFHSPRVFPSCRGVYPDAFQLRAHLEDVPREKRTSS